MKLSGGERRRLQLAKILSRPCNLLVLDEPTNDLDLETLELLEELLLEFQGTLLVVSHDRAFLDNVVTSTLVFEGDGRWREYVGGYEDWLRQKKAAEPPPAPRSRSRPRPERADGAAAAGQLQGEARAGGAARAIESLETEKQQLFDLMASPGFYATRGDEVARTKTAALPRSKPRSTRPTRAGWSWRPSPPARSREPRGIGTRKRGAVGDR